jgi:hypothetical protein
LNVTVPVAADGETVAVKVTGFPYVDVGKDDTTLIETAAFVTDCDTVFDVDVE